MDSVDGLEIELDRDVYYPGDTMHAHALISTLSNVKVRGITVTLRGRVQVQWKVIKNAAVYTVKNCKILIDQKKVIWGITESSEAYTSEIPVLKAGSHRIGFSFKLDGSDLPSSFESRLGSVRYYLHANIDIPYASPPQTIKHFTLIMNKKGPFLQQWLVPIQLERRHQSACMACSRGNITLQIAISRTAFCCGENIPLQMDITNGSEVKLWPVIQFIQTVVYTVDKAGLGVRKEAVHVVWEYTGPTVPKHSSLKLENLSQVLSLPVLPPSLDASQSNLCDIIQIDYRLIISLNTHKWGEPIRTTLPILITSYYPPTASLAVNERDSWSSKSTQISTVFKPADEEVEGGNYISPELQIGGDVYDGTTPERRQSVIIYQPVYACMQHIKPTTTSTARFSFSKSPQPSKSKKMGQNSSINTHSHNSNHNEDRCTSNNAMTLASTSSDHSDRSSGGNKLGSCVTSL